MPRHTLQLRQLHSTHLTEQVACQFLKYFKHILLVSKRHLTVNLSELGLTVGTQVFVAEALCNLEIAVESTHHKQLLQRLRRLRKSIELPGIHTARNHKVAGTFRCRADKYRGLYLYELLRVKEIADKNGHAVAQFQIFSYARAAQIQITIFHANIIATISLVFDCERRCLALAQYIQLFYKDLNVASFHLRVLRLTLTYCSHNLDTPLTTKSVSLFAKFSILGLVKHQLCQSIAVTQVNKRHTAHLSGSLNPSGQFHLLSGIGKSELATSISSIHIY